VREPVADLKEFLRCRQGVESPHRAMTVDRKIAEVFDDARLVEDRITDRLLERGFVNQCAQMVLVGQTECAIVLVEPRNREFERPSRIEARRAWVRVDQILRLRCRLVKRHPFGKQEGEVAHSECSVEGAVLKSTKERIERAERLS